MKKYFVLSVLLLIVFVTILISCNGDGKKKGDSKILSEVIPKDVAGAVEGDWIIIREMSDAEKLNPIVTNDATAESIYTLMYESLNDMDYITYEQIPRIGSLPEVSADLKYYIYTINKNAKFSDGTPVTGNDVIFTMKAIKNPFADDAALRNYYDRVGKIELVDGDPYKIKYTMAKPYWLAKYMNGDFSILPKHVLDPEGLTDKYSWEELVDFKTAEKNPAIKKFADFLNSQEVSREAKYLIASGPYVFESWQTGQSVTLARNDNYWNKANVPNYPKKIVFKTIQDNSASIVAAKNKEIDLMSVVVPADFYKNLDNASEFNLVRITPSEPSYTYLGWNNNSPLFSDKKVRWALSHLVDRKSIIEKISYGKAIPIQSPIYYNQKKYFNSELPDIPFDIEKAKKLLAEAGWTDSDGNGILDKVIDGKKTEFKFTFLLNTNPTRQQTCLIIIDALKKVGIQADVQQLEWSVYLDKTKKHEFDATMGAWVLGVTPPDPYQIFHSSQMKGEGSNYISYNNPESDKLIEEYRNETDDAKQVDIIKRWQKIIYDDQPCTFLWTPLARYVYNDRYKNTRFYAKRNSPLVNEWWVPAANQKYKQTMN
jgi:peptide/nickel transport system substrate-binding protein